MAFTWLSFGVDPHASLVSVLLKVDCRLESTGEARFDAKERITEAADDPAIKLILAGLAFPAPG